MSEMITETIGGLEITRWPDAPMANADSGLHEVPRWAGRLALKRHVLEQGALVLLAPDDARPEDNLLARVLAWRDTLQPGEMLDRVDAVLNDAKDWLRDSETVAAVAQVLGLTAEQVDALFAWAAAQRA
ncbi:hypothetical protein [Delftia acidovorans]|uniref:hypothetical protein n=1 Tax=Delftia acidovorans TaxID=80866 RepID=UPI00241E25C2|nr:hypothetical protein [Delftia acidovorans]